jgi:hypothetical protein
MAMDLQPDKDAAPLRHLPSFTDLRAFVRWLFTGRLP